MSSFLLLILFLSGLARSQRLIPFGRQQIYELSNRVTVGELRPSADAGVTDATSYTFQTRLQINSVWSSGREQLLQLFFVEPSVSGPLRSTISQLPDRPFYISLLDDGQVDKVVAHTSRDQSLLNLERAIASLLQLQLRPDDQTIDEMDVSGRCRTSYRRVSSTRIEKTKLACSNWDLKVHDRAEKPLSVGEISELKSEFDLGADGALLQASTVESHRFFLEAKDNVGSRVESQLVLRRVAAVLEEHEVEQLPFDSLNATVTSLLDWYRVFGIAADVDGAVSVDHRTSNLSHLIALHEEQLADARHGSEALAALLVTLLPVARVTATPEFVAILQRHQRLHGHLADLLGAARSRHAHEAMRATFAFSGAADTASDDATVDIVERYLHALSVAARPDRAIIVDLLTLLDAPDGGVAADDRLHGTLVRTVAALARNAALPPSDALRRRIRSLLLDGLAGASGRLYIGALQNLRDPQTLPALLQQVLDGGVASSVAAMDALRTFAPAHFDDDEHRRLLEGVFLQRRRRYDWSARSAALDILLSLRPSQRHLDTIVDYVAADNGRRHPHRQRRRHRELVTYTRAQLRLQSERCPHFRRQLAECLARRPPIRGLSVGAMWTRDGLTTALLRRMSLAPAFNESLLSVQEVERGILKRGSVDLLLAAGHQDMSMFRLRIFTAGLTAFMTNSNMDDNDDGGGDDGDDDDNDVVGDDDDIDSDNDGAITAGMEIAVQGTLLRPLIFFRGQTELMAHLWGGTASEMTPAYQATTIAHDHELYVVLASGGTVHLRLAGARSIDLSGQVAVSLWNRNADTKIRQNTGATIVGHLVAGFTYAKVTHTFTVRHEPQLLLEANVDFYADMKLCLRLQQPTMTMIHSNVRTAFVNGSSGAHTTAFRSNVSHTIHGRTFALNQMNNDMCNALFAV